MQVDFPARNLLTYRFQLRSHSLFSSFFLPNISQLTVSPKARGGTPPPHLGTQLLAALHYLWFLLVILENKFCALRPSLFFEASRNCALRPMAQAPDRNLRPGSLARILFSILWTPVSPYKPSSHPWFLTLFLYLTYLLVLVFTAYDNSLSPLT